MSEAIPELARNYLANRNPQVLRLSQKRLSAQQADALIVSRTRLRAVFCNVTKFSLVAYLMFVWALFALQPDSPLPVFASIYGCMIIGAPYVYISPIISKSIALLQPANFSIDEKAGIHSWSPERGSYVRPIPALDAWRADVSTLRDYRMYDVEVFQAIQWALLSLFNHRSTYDYPQVA